MKEMMKERIHEAISRYIVLNLAFVPMLLPLRLYEYFFLRPAPEFPQNALAVEMTGIIHDLFALSVFALVVSIPFTLIFLWKRRIAVVFYIFLLCLLTVIQLGIIKYFSITLTPLDEVIYDFSLKENLLIIGTSDVTFSSFIPMIFAVAMIILIQIAVRKVRLKRPAPYFAGGFLTAAFLFSFIVPWEKTVEEPVFSHYMKISKAGFFAKRSVIALCTPSRENLEMISEDITFYHSLHPYFNFTGENYPLLHAENTPNTLGPFFRLTSRPPNLVFIIVESLSSSHVGDSSWYGNFTPFLDSLKNHSLYWNNFLSTSERTFHVLQALFGSLPYGKGDFQKDMAVMPDHFSLLRSLRKNGYFTGFYYGGDASFTNYDQFLKKQGLDFQLRYFGPKYDQQILEHKDFRWGYQDGAVYERAMEVIDSLGKEPRIDIFLTLSTHFPFEPPNSGYYLDQAQKILDSPGFDMKRKIRSAPFKKLFSSVLYTDDALRSLLKAYSKRPDYDNTVFIITGDHSFTEFGNLTISAIEHYHVPMVIFSPLLERARTFASVSSHLDVTPSLLAMLNAYYGFRGENYTHWLGLGIDTTSEFRNIHTLALTRKSNKTVDYLKADYFYSDKLLYRISEGLKTTPVIDEVKFREMSSELRASVAVYNYTNQNNLMIPPNSFRVVKQEPVAVKLNESKVLQAITPGQEFLNLIYPTEIPSGFLKLVLGIRFRYMIGQASDTASFPKLAVSIDDRNFHSSLYHILRFPDVRTTSVKPGIWHSVDLRQELDVKMIDSLKGQFLKLYFVYGKPSSIRFDSLSVNINGIK